MWKVSTKIGITITEIREIEKTRFKFDDLNYSALQRYSPDDFTFRKTNFFLFIRILKII